MKKIVALVLLFIVVLQVGLVFAAEDAEIKVQINGKYVSFDSKPVIIDGSTMVHCRGIAEAMGGKVEYKTENAVSDKGENYVKQIIVIKTDNRTIETVVGESTATVNLDGKKDDLYMYKAPMIIDGRTFVPLRFIGSALGCKVDWDSINSTVVIIDTNTLWEKLKISSPNLYKALDSNIIKDGLKILESADVKASFVADANQSTTHVSIGANINGESNFSNGNMQAKYKAKVNFENTKQSVAENGFDSNLKAEMDYNFNVILKDNVIYVRYSTLGLVDLFDSSGISGKWFKFDIKNSPFKIDKSFKVLYNDMFLENIDLDINTYEQINSAINYIGILEKMYITEKVVDGKKHTTFKFSLDDIKKLITDETMYKQLGLDDFFKLKPTFEMTIESIDSGEENVDTTSSLKFGCNINDIEEYSLIKNGRLNIEITGKNKYSRLDKDIDIQAPNTIDVFDPMAFETPTKQPYLEKENQPTLESSVGEQS